MFKRNGVINMGKERYSILFSSMTGNTKELADAIREILPEETLDYFGLCKDADPQSEILYIGFWTDKGTADEATTTLLKSLRNKKIFLFGTAGFGGSEEYYQKVLHNVRENIDPSNQIVGEYMCQGKMPIHCADVYRIDLPEHGKSVLQFAYCGHHPQQGQGERVFPPVSDSKSRRRDGFCCSRIYVSQLLMACIFAQWNFHRHFFCDDLFLCTEYHTGKRRK